MMRTFNPGQAEQILRKKFPTIYEAALMISAKTGQSHRKLLFYAVHSAEWLHYGLLPVRSFPTLMSRLLEIGSPSYIMTYLLCKENYVNLVEKPRKLRYRLFQASVSLFGFISRAKHIFSNIFIVARKSHKPTGKRPATLFAETLHPASIASKSALERNHENFA
ncbi:MAG: hypothetical protein DRP63_01800 [Planctomycetota bacterium]|nr:MAG: hypothetical protein DRP63_01800 [Planctomycetota bacterium]